MCTKNHKNPCIFVKVIVKKSVAPFLSGHGVEILDFVTFCRPVHVAKVVRAGAGMSMVVR